MALTKAELAEALFEELGLNKREARELVDLFFEELRAFHGILCRHRISDKHDFRGFENFLDHPQFFH